MKLKGRMFFTSVDAYCEIKGSKYASRRDFEEFESKVRDAVVSAVRERIDDSNHIHCTALVVPNDAPSGIVITVMTSGKRNLTLEEIKKIRKSIMEVKREL